MSQLHWERGFRCHGYWLGTTMFGRVSIGPRGFWKPADGYGWDLMMPGRPKQEGDLPTLREAKQQVERLVQETFDSGYDLAAELHKLLYTFR